MTERELLIRCFQNIKPGSHYLEIGVWAGASLCMAAKYAPVDAWIMGIEAFAPKHIASYATSRAISEHPAISLWAKIGRLSKINANKICIFPVRSEDFINGPVFKWLCGRIGFLYIDGDHTYDQVILDAKYINLVVPGGIVAFHDYRTSNPNFTGTVRGTDEAIIQYALARSEQAESLIVCHKCN